MKEGGHRGLEECQNQFKNDVWNCTLDNKLVLKELPIFVKTTLPYGEILYRFLITCACGIIAKSLRKKTRNRIISLVVIFFSINHTTLLESILEVFRLELRMKTKKHVLSVGLFVLAVVV